MRVSASLRAHERATTSSKAATVVADGDDWQRCRGGEGARPAWACVWGGLQGRQGHSRARCCRCWAAPGPGASSVSTRSCAVAKPRAPALVVRSAPAPPEVAGSHHRSWASPRSTPVTSLGHRAPAAAAGWPRTKGRSAETINQRLRCPAAVRMGLLEPASVRRGDERRAYRVQPCWAQSRPTSGSAAAFDRVHARIHLAAVAQPPRFDGGRARSGAPAPTTRRRHDNARGRPTASRTMRMRTLPGDTRYAGIRCAAARPEDGQFCVRVAAVPGSSDAYARQPARGRAARVRKQGAGPAWFDEPGRRPTPGLGEVGALREAMARCTASQPPTRAMPPAPRCRGRPGPMP